MHSMVFVNLSSNFRCSAEPVCKTGMEHALKDPRGASPFLSGTCVIPLFCLTYRQALLRQVQRDDNIQTLLEAILDAFEFAEEADTLRDLKPNSRQAKILEDMLKCVSECAEFIRSYAEDVKVGMSSWSLAH
jgi:hypothetical protein